MKTAHHPARTAFTVPSLTVLLLACLSLAGGLWLSGCDSGSDTPSGTPDTGNTHAALVDACTLLTQADAETIMGKPVETTKRDTTLGYITGCTYYGSINPGFVLATYLKVTFATNAGLQAHLSPSQTAATYHAGLKTTLAADSWAQMAGIGDGVIWLTKQGRLSCYKGDVVIETMYRANGTPAIDTSSASKAGASAAATAAITHL
jgi:hypothetical protein